MSQSDPADNAIADLLDQAEAAAENEPARIDGLLDRIRQLPDLASAEPADALRAARLLAVSGSPADLLAVAELAGAAHRAGLDGAGPVFAEASDKIALYQGQPQRYGTVMVEHQGEIVQPPVDPTTGDDERTALGLPTMAEMQERMVEVSRMMARERVHAPQLPAGQPFCRVWTDPEPAEIRARMASEGAPAWADGDILTFVAETDEPVAITPTFPISTWNVGDGLQVLSVRIDRLSEAVITYTFTPLSGGMAPSFSRGSHDGRFRGVDAPKELPSNDPLIGSLTEHDVASHALGDSRTVSVYRPPGHEPGEDIPVVYATDGNMFAPYARRLDAAIEAGTCPRVVVVAAHSAGTGTVAVDAGMNLRALEYLLGFDDQRFDAHQRFFITELAAWAETEIGVARAPERRGVFGCSDGGGHAITVAQLHPRKFGHVFAYSTGMAPDPSAMAGNAWGPDTHPFIHLCAGTLEGPFHQATAAWAGYLGLCNAPHHFTERVAGHDLIQWAEELPRALARAWG